MKMKSLNSGVANLFLILLVFINNGAESFDIENIGTEKHEHFNVDEWLDDSAGCFWHMMCDLNIPLRIKSLVDILDNKTILFATETFSPRFDQHIADELNLKNVRDKKFWINFLQPEACRFSDEERKRYAEEMQPDFIAYGQKICKSMSTKDECLKLWDSGNEYYELQGEMMKNGECLIRHQNAEKMKF